jgi:hypothetical protein
MAQNNANGSNRAKFLRKVKRKASQATRALKAYQLQWFNTQCNLVAVLGQLGGETTVTQGTYTQAREGVIKGELSYEVVAGKVPGESILKLVTRQAEPPVEGSPIVPDGDDPNDIVNGPREGFDADGEYQFDTTESDALLNEEGQPYEVIQQIGRDDID